MTESAGVRDLRLTGEGNRRGTRLLRQEIARGTGVPLTAAAAIGSGGAKTENVRLVYFLSIRVSWSSRTSLLVAKERA